MATRAVAKHAPLDRPEPRRPTECPVEDWLTFLGHRWKALMLWHLQEGPKRFGELSSLLPGIAPKVLSERLNALAERGLVLRSTMSAFPRGVTYSLSPASRDLLRILNQLEIWSRRRDAGH